jgi:hypothetical protein
VKQSQIDRLESFVLCSSLLDSIGLHRNRRRFARVADHRRAIVVGVDGLPGALKAVTWATTEAERRRVPLHLVYAIDPSDGSVATGVTARTADRSNAALESAVA